MIQAGEGWALTPHELQEGVLICPQCEDPCFLDQLDGVDLAVCACGFNTAATAINNLPPTWVAEALDADLLEGVREQALTLLEDGDEAGRALGQSLLTELEGGAQDLEVFRQARGAAAGPLVVALDQLLEARGR